MSDHIGLSDSALKEAIENKNEFSVSLLTRNADKAAQAPDTLHAICRNGWLDIVKHLIQTEGLDPQAKDSVHGATPLHFACTSGNIELVKYLINECLSDHLIVSDDQFTTLHCAVMGGLDTTMYLIESLPNSDILFHRAQNLMCYVYYIWSNNDNDNKLVKYLLAEKHCSIIVNDDTGDTILHYACKNTSIIQIKFLIQDCNCDPHVTNYNGDTLLHTYCSTINSCKDMLLLLNYLCTECQCNPLLLNADGRSALEYAIMNEGNGLPIVRCLIEQHGCAVLFESHGRIRIMSLAYIYWNDAIIKYLLNNFTMVIDEDTGETLLHKTFKKQQFAKARFLIEECNYNPNVIDKMGNTIDKSSISDYVLKNAIEDDQKDLVQSLLTNYDKAALLGSDTLHATCRNGWLDIVKHLIQKGLDPQEKDSVHGATPLHFACTSGNTELVKYLINECLSDHLIVSDDHFTTLHCAVMGGLDTTMYLLESLPNSDILCQRTQTLMRYVYYIWSNNDNDNKLVKYLLDEKNCSIIIGNKNTGDTMLHYACRDKNIKQLKFLVQDCNCNPHVTNYNGDTLLHAYCSSIRSHKENIDSLLLLNYLCTECRCNPLLLNADGRSALEYAIMNEGIGLPIIRCLIEQYGCSVLFENDGGIRIMSSAYQYWNDSIMKYLILNNIFTIVIDEDTGETILNKTCKKQQFTKARFLIEECNCNPNVIDKMENAIDNAIEKNQKDLVQLLLTHYDKTALLFPDTLHAICRNGWLDIVKHLIQKGLDPQEKDSVHGATPLHFACTSGNTELVKYLINECLSDHLIVSDDHFTTLHCAVMGGGLDTAMYLLESLPNSDILCQRTQTLMRYVYYIWSNNDNDNKLVKYLLVEKHFSIIVNDDTGDTILHYACRNGNIIQMKFLIQDCNCDPHMTNYNGDTLLHIYCSTLNSCKEKNDVLLLLHYLCTECQCNPLLLNADGRSALEYAILNEGNGLPIVCCLIEQHGCAVLFENHGGIRIMSLAYKYWNDAIVRYLLLKNNFTMVIDEDTGETILHKTCETQQFTKTRFLIAECNCNPNVIDKMGNTIVHAVCRMKNLSEFTSEDFELLNYICTKCRFDSRLSKYFCMDVIKFAIPYQDKGLPIVHRMIENPGYTTIDRKDHDLITLAYNNWHNDMIECLVSKIKYVGSGLLQNVCKDDDIVKVRFLVEKCDCLKNIEPATKLNTSNFDILYYLCVECKCNHSMFDIKYILSAVMENSLNETKKCIQFCDHLHHVSTLLYTYQVDAISLAYTHWCNEMIKHLIVELRLNVIYNQDTCTSILHIACEETNINRLKFLMEECNCNPNAIDKFGNTLVHVVCQMKNLREFNSKDFELLNYICTKGKFDLKLSEYLCMDVIKFAIPYGDKGLPIVHRMFELNPGCANIARFDSDLIKLVYNNWHNDMIECLVSELIYIGSGLLQNVCKDDDIVKVRFLVEKCDCLENLEPATKLNTNNFDILYYLCVECQCNHSMFDSKYILSTVMENSLNETKKCIDFCDHLFIISTLFYTYQVDAISLAYTHWCNEMIKHLIVDLGLSVIYNQDTCTSILHRACEETNINRLKFLLEECKCNPCIVNAIGDTLLHTVCRSFAFSNEDLEIIHYLTTEYECFKIHLLTDRYNNTILHLLCNLISSDNNYSMACIDAVYYLSMNYKMDGNIKNANGVTILHQLCKNKKSNLHLLVIELIFYLIDEGICDPMIEDEEYNTTLHFLSGIKRYSPDMLELVYHLIYECKCDINSKNKLGNTPLHIACIYFTGDSTVIEYILSTGKADPLARNDSNLTPLMYLHLHDNMDTGRVERLITRFGEIQIVHPITSYVNVILLGNPGVGKSTLAKVINDRNKYSTFNQFRSVKEVKLHTAGIIPHILNDRQLGRIILHDLAGQAEYYSSHTAVLENLLQGSAAVFVIVVSLADENLLSSLHLWLTIVENVSSNAFYQCQLLLVASHVDQPIYNKSVALEKITQVMIERINAKVILNTHGVHSLDCRKLGGNHLSSLISTLSIACQDIAQTNKGKEMSLYCHMLYEFLQQSAQNVYTLESLVNEAKEVGSNVILLPKDIVQVAKILSTLSSTGLIVFMKNHTHLKKSWIVTDKSILLSELDGILFAPKDFKEYINIASNTGIIKLSELGNLFPAYDCELLIQFLQYMELCQLITKEFITSNIVQSLPDINASNDDQRIFVPALIKDSQKPVIEETFTFGWCLRCSNPHHFFLSRFLHLVLLHLAYKFSVPRSADHKFERLCKIWTTGIYWKNTKGVQVLVDLINNNQSLVLLVTCHDGAINEMFKLVKDVIIEILSCKQQVMPKVDVFEDVIDNCHLMYPLQSLDDLTLYNIELLAECYINRDPFILDRTGMVQTSITKLFLVTQVTYCEAIFADRDPKKLMDGILEYSKPDEHGIVSVLLNETNTTMKVSTACQDACSTELTPTGQLLKKHIPRLIEAISESQILKLTNDLWSIDLLSDNGRDEIMTNHSLSRYSKVNYLLDEVRKNVLVCEEKAWENLVIFCNVLKQQMDPTLSRISKEMIPDQTSPTITIDESIDVAEEIMKHEPDQDNSKTFNKLGQLDSGVLDEVSVQDESVVVLVNSYSDNSTTITPHDSGSSDSNMNIILSITDQNATDHYYSEHKL